MLDDDKDTQQDDPSSDDQDRGRKSGDLEKGVGGKTTRIYKESYQPDNDDLDSSKPPQGSGVPPKDSGNKDDDQ